MLERLPIRKNRAKIKSPIACPISVVVADVVMSIDAVVVSISVVGIAVVVACVVVASVVVAFVVVIVVGDEVVVVSLMTGPPSAATAQRNCKCCISWQFKGCHWPWSKHLKCASAARCGSASPVAEADAEAAAEADAGVAP